MDDAKLDPFIINRYCNQFYDICSIIEESVTRKENILVRESEIETIMRNYFEDSSIKENKKWTVSSENERIIFETLQQMRSVESFYPFSITYPTETHYDPKKMIRTPTSIGTIIDLKIRPEVRYDGNVLIKSLVRTMI